MNFRTANEPNTTYIFRQVRRSSKVAKPEKMMKHYNTVQIDYFCGDGKRDRTAVNRGGGNIPRWPRLFWLSRPRPRRRRTGRRRRPRRCCPRPTVGRRWTRPARSSPCSWAAGTLWRLCATRWCPASGRRTVSSALVPRSWLGRATRVDREKRPEAGDRIGFLKRTIARENCGSDGRARRDSFGRLVVRQ